MIAPERKEYLDELVKRAANMEVGEILKACNSFKEYVYVYEHMDEKDRKPYSNPRWHEPLIPKVCKGEYKKPTAEEKLASRKRFRKYLAEVKGISKEELDKQLPID